MRQFILLSVVFFIALSLSLYAGGNAENTDINTQAKEVEVLHWWTSGSEAVALNILKEELASNGIRWVDYSIIGGAGEQAMTELRSRVIAGNPPTAAQMLGFNIVDWVELGVVANLNAIAEEGNWDEIIPDAIKKFSKYNGKWVAVPVNIHSTNWIWGNIGLLNELGVTIPTTWDEYIAVLEKVQSSGKIALAHGGQAWQTATLFEGVVLATGGPIFYQKALIDLEVQELNSMLMKEVFDRMTILRSYVDDNFADRNWDTATAMVINGQAAFQMMGDWGKGEFMRAGMMQGKDFVGIRMPGTQGAVIFNADQFVMFKVGGERELAQEELAKTIMSSRFQKKFNRIKGSIPIRMDIASTNMDMMSQKAMQDMEQASQNEALLGSMAHGYAVSPAVQSAMFDVITRHFNGEYSSKQAVRKLVDAIQAAQ